MGSAQLLNDLSLRVETYNSVLKAAEQENNASKVRRYKRILAQYSTTIKQVSSGDFSSLGDLPNPPGFPPLMSASNSTSTSLDDNFMEVDKPLYPSENVIAEKVLDVPSINTELQVSPGDFNLNEALQVRLDKYTEVMKQSEQDGNASKTRRYTRIIAQYNEALVKTMAGKPVDLSVLPNPPGFEPLVPTKSPVPSPQPSPLPVRAASVTSHSSDTPASQTGQPSAPQRNVSRAEKQTALLRSRQQEFKEAAISAKRSGQLVEAKEFLKMYKGFDRLIQASEGGLPVDLSTIPPSPKSYADLENSSFHVVSEKDFAGSDDSDVFVMLKNELSEQITSCMARRKQFKDTGDIANANKFENFALSFKKDLNKIALYQSSGNAVPKFHFEQKSFPVVNCFSDIPAGILELTIVQAVNLAKVSDVYIGYEFPYPSENPPSGYTSIVKNSVNPNFGTKLTFPIDRDSKPCQRIFKRHGIKFEVWCKGGFFQRDSSLGTVVVKLLPLATNIMIHDAFDIMNGRRATGAKLEVKIRVRDPLISKKIETISEKWLILD